MDWIKIFSAMVLVMMLVAIWPSARYWLKNSPKASSQQWMTALIPIGVVGLFIVLLVSLV